jgi:hypothetical protein
MDPLMSRGEEAAPAPVAGRKRLSLVVVLVVVGVLAATVATSAVVFSGHKAPAEAAALAEFSVTARGGKPVLVFDIRAPSRGVAHFGLLGGAAFEDGLPDASVLVHVGRNRIELRLSPSTKPGGYFVEVQSPGGATLVRTFSVPPQR